MTDAISKRGGFRIPKKAIPYVLLAPIFIYYAIFWLLPVLTSVKEVFTDFDGHFTLFGNFKLMGESEYFKESVINTALFAFVSVVLEYIVALVLAVVLNISFPGNKIMMFISMIPMAITPTATAILWKTGLMSDGWINTILVNLHLVDKSFVYMNAEGLQAVGMLILIDAWTVTPSVMVILIAGLQGLQKDQKEAAYLFGATKMQIFRDVTIPALRPSITTSIITRMIAAIQVWSISVMVLGYGKAPFLVERVAFYVEEVPGLSTSSKLAYTYSFFTTVAVLIATVFYLRMTAKNSRSQA